MIQMLAVFWYRNGHCFGAEAPIKSKHAVAYGDYVQLDYDHFVIWDAFRKEEQLPSFMEYDSVPRGRILFHIPTHHYIVIGTSSIVKNKEAKENVKVWYHLPANTEFRSDEHYG